VISNTQMLESSDLNSLQGQSSYLRKIVPSLHTYSLLLFHGKGYLGIRDTVISQTGSLTTCSAVQCSAALHILHVWTPGSF
jgi:hypothetical protein